LQPRGILARNDPRARVLEGLEQRVDVLAGEVPDSITVTESGIDESTSRFLLTLWNTYSFFVLYANIGDVEVNWGGLMASALVISLPVVALFFVLQRNTTQVNTGVQLRDSLIDFVEANHPCGWDPANEMSWMASHPGVSPPAVTFDTGTNNWSRGLALDGQGVGTGEPNLTIQQATANVFEDMTVT